MSTTTIVLLLIGGTGIAILAVSLLGVELLNFGHIAVDGPFSLEAIAAFLGALGFGGAVASELINASGAAGLFAAAGIGAVAAVPVAYLTLRLSKAARDMRTDATPTRNDLVGSLGLVVTTIPAGGFGEVRVRLGGQQIKLYARAASPIAMGARIFVVEALSDTSVVVEETPAISQP